MSHLGDRLSALVDGRLDPADHDRVLAHLRHCAECRAEADHARWLRERLHRLPGAEPSAALLMALHDISAGTEVLACDDPAVHWRWPSRRHAGLALAGAGTVAAGVLGLAYMVGSTPAADPVSPPVEQFSSEFAGAGDPPFSDPVVEVYSVLDRDATQVSRR